MLKMINQQEDSLLRGIACHLKDILCKIYATGLKRVLQLLLKKKIRL